MYIHTLGLTRTNIPLLPCIYYNSMYIHALNIHYIWNRLAWPHRRRELASDGVRYADARNSVGRRVGSVVKLMLAWYGGIFLLLQQRSKKPQEMVNNAQGVNLNFALRRRRSYFRHREHLPPWGAHAAQPLLYINIISIHTFGLTRGFILSIYTLSIFTTLFFYRRRCPYLRHRKVRVNPRRAPLTLTTMFFYIQTELSAFSTSQAPPS